MLGQRLLPLFRHINGCCRLARRHCHSFKPSVFSTDSDYFAQLQINQKLIDRLAALDKHRKCRGDIAAVQRLFEAHTNEADDAQRNALRTQLIAEIKKFPNDTHPTVLGYGADAGPVELYAHGDLFESPNPKARTFDELTFMSNTLRMDSLGNYSGSRSYYLMHSVAELEQALIRYTVDVLLNEGFELMSVPDILPDTVIEGCGMDTNGARAQVFRLQPSDLCLSGTSEMALAGYFSGKTLDAAALPKKVMAVSRCFRAEAKESTTKSGRFYRVRCFTKVEMFAVCKPDQSDAVLEQFRQLQCRLFEGLGMCFKLYDMPIGDLGAPAYRKYDIEAYMVTLNGFGEISSTSNCTDYQSKRLNIYYRDGDTKYHAHTVNGTACAIPRMLIALLEQYQTPRSIKVPDALQPYMGASELRTSNVVPRVALLKHNRTEA